MTLSLAALPLKQGLVALSDVITALQDHVANLQADEAVVSDGLAIATVFDPALIPVAMALPAAEFLVALFLANNISAMPGALSHIAGGERGNTGSDGGAVP